MNDESLWFKPLIDRVKVDLDELCPIFEVSDLCRYVLESILQVDPLWFEGKKVRTVVASILYISVLLGKGPRRGYLKKVLESVGVSKPSVKDAVGRFVLVDWEDGVVYLNPRFYKVLSGRVGLPEYVVPYLAKEVIRIKLRKTAPGLFEFLEMQCVKELNKDCVSIIFEEPDRFKDIVLKRYGEPVIARRIIERYLAPIMKVLGLEDPPRRLAELLMNNPEEFRKTLLSSLSSLRKR